MHCVFATITPKEQFFDIAKNAILSILEPTRQEAGCVQFDVHSNKEQTQLFLYEQWKSEQDLQLHYQQNYTQRVFEAYEKWLAKPVDITTFNLLEK
ncbi:putative quinol monooxygenase [Paraglaciecola sp. 2405UD69-4]|uniref:putative quinol monooxygenase n=1 Tax=Paraglaciecola sp. 2405UD69-4 TaxID=3391836 RepID=UPI0039C8E7FE